MRDRSVAKTNEMSNSGATAYVVTQGAKPATPLALLLQKYPGVIVLDELDDLTALVQMPEDVHRAIALDLPHLVMEPNLDYKLSA